MARGEVEPGDHAVTSAVAARLARVRRPHVLGIDDGPFEMRAGGEAPIVGVVTEGADLVESVAVTRFPVDGADATAFLAAWIDGLRVRPALHAILLGGITIAGLGVVDLVELAARTRVPVVALGRRDPRAHRLGAALSAAGVAERLSIVARTPAARRLERGLYAACAGLDDAQLAALMRTTRRKALLPEALRLAHLIARAVALGESRGRA